MQEINDDEVEIVPSIPLIVMTKSYENKSNDDDYYDDDYEYNYDYSLSQNKDTNTPKTTWAEQTTTTKATTTYKPQTTTLDQSSDPAYRYYYSPNGTLYHDRNVSCDRGGTITYDNKQWSKTPPSGYKPCPVCFPNG